MNKVSLYTILGLTAALALTGLSGCSAPAEAQEAGDPGVPIRPDETRHTPVRTVTVEPTRFVEYGEYFGEARGIDEVKLTAVAGGRVSTLRATVGDTVAAGTSLGKIDPGKARTLYDTAVLNERLARESWERERRFLEQGNSFQVKVDQAHLRWLEAKAALLDAERLLDAALMVTPITGTVVRRHIEVHDDVAPGDPTVEVADLSRMRITVGVPEADIAGVRELAEAEVIFPAIPDRVFTGTPTGFARARSEETLTYEVEIEVDNPDGAILSGQTARVRLPLHSSADAIVVPSSAVRISSDGTSVFVVKNGVARVVPVVTGVTGERETVITRGLAPGDAIVAEGVNRLADGTPVEILR
jgi:RND family efflux transporter MFP subunit